MLRLLRIFPGHFERRQLRDQTCKSIAEEPSVIVGTVISGRVDAHNSPLLELRNLHTEVRQRSSNFRIIAEKNKFRTFVPQLIEHDPDVGIGARRVRIDIETELKVPAHDRAALKLCDVDISLRELADDLVE